MCQISYATIMQYMPFINLVYYLPQKHFPVSSNEKNSFYSCQLKVQQILDVMVLTQSKWISSYLTLFSYPQTTPGSEPKKKVMQQLHPVAYHETNGILTSEKCSKNNRSQWTSLWEVLSYNYSFIIQAMFYFCPSGDFAFLAKIDSWIRQDRWLVAYVLFQ